MGQQRQRQRDCRIKSFKYHDDDMSHYLVSLHYGKR